ncbi:pyridoxine/pyridoxamine 5'-phosphate oxidase [Ruania halotolerans]|uniref:pyridoxine/pyridoxamine 5'-phosphate oxidase n=1 Tax=Ruania halotolerans TaxID=2897773 RepID=UPI001E2DA58B|nr:pyridoxamine 5'-phosphate oxidase family protein [Ruania halotolerans]UFU07039.1 pyridoxamine 5'-phosphate oxidase family protein [Ruania halotolerans]
MPETLAAPPLPNLARWVAEADDAGLPLPSTMTLATADADGAPHARTVLVTQIDGMALRFHTSSPTTKSEDIAANPRVAAVFHWPSLGRQVILTGTARELPAEVSEAAYPTRPRQLQLVAWAYQDLAGSAPTPDLAVSNDAIRERFDAAAARDPLPRPAGWTTIELTPWQVDFWQAGTDDTPPVKTRFTADGPTAATHTGAAAEDATHDAWRRIDILP